MGKLIFMLSIEMVNNSCEMLTHEEQTLNAAKQVSCAAPSLEFVLNIRVGVRGHGEGLGWINSKQPQHSMYIYTVAFNCMWCALPPSRCQTQPLSSSQTPSLHIDTNHHIRLLIQLALFSFCFASPKWNWYTELGG